MANLNPGSLEALPKPTSPSRSGGRHQIKRSLSELAAPVKIHRHNHHLHRRERHHDDKGHMPAHPPGSTRHSLDISSSTGVTPLMSPSQSRRASILVQNEEIMGMDFRVNEEERLREEKQKATIRADGLRQSILDLDTFSTSTTRQLDETYYEVLEKMSSLQNSVMALKELAENTHDICHGFDKDSRELEHEIVTQLGAVGHFDQQQARILSLQKRVQGGRKKIQALAGRVDVVRERIEGWERADKAWQESTRKRLKIIWTVMSAVALTVIILILGIRYSYPELGTSQVAGQTANMTGRAGASVWRNASKATQQPAVERGGAGKLWKTPMNEGERLRAFDEL